MLRVGLAEDSPELRELARHYLSKKGYFVEEYADGMTALEAVLANKPHILISDIQMPRLTGLDLTRRIRQVFDKKRLPIVLVSVMSEEEDIVRGFEAGANDYLVKPYRPQELLAKVAVLTRGVPYLRNSDEPPLPPEGTPETLGGAPVFFDKYEILGEFGRGATGRVYRAIKRDDGRVVALKVVSPRISEDRASIARFLREVHLLSNIACDHIVRTYDHGYDCGRYFMAMEAVDGESLHHMAYRPTPLDQTLACDIFAQISIALQALSDRGLVHRDIKPANIIRRRDGISKLVDFGLARDELETNVTDDSAAYGTVNYMAPEIILGNKADAQSDLFSFGATMFEALTSRRAFPGEITYHVFQDIVQGRSPDPREFRPDLSRGLVEIIQKLLERDPRKRYRLASEVAHDLERLALSSPILPES